MKNLITKSFYSVLMLGIVFAFGMMTGSTTFAIAAMGTVGFMSALSHSGVLGNVAFNAPVLPDFTPKTKAEISSLSEEDLTKYLDERKAFENAEIELKHYNQIEALKTELAGDKEGLEKLIKEADENMKKHQKEAEDMFLMIKGLQEKGTKGGEDEATTLMKWFKSDDRKNLLEKGTGIERVTLKAAELMSIAAVGAGSAHITEANGFSINVNNFIDPKIYSAPKNKNIFLNLVSVSTSPGTEKIWWSERNNEEGDAAFIAEGGTKPLVDANWQTFSADIFEVAERWKFTKRMMLHTNSVVNDFQTHARQLIDLKIDDEVLGGDGIAPNMSGIVDQASAFVVPAALANYYPYVNIWDVIMAVKTQIEVANFAPTSVVLHTTWFAKMYGIKSETEAMYISHPLMTPDGRSMAGMTLIFTNKIDADYILVGDLSEFNVKFAEDIMYDEGYENDDFSKNLVSRKLEAYLGTYIPSTQVPAIVYDEIATIEAAIADTAS